MTDRSAHFKFGENWRDYAKLIDQKRIDDAVDGLRKLLPDGLSGKTFLDLGCGSGLHSLAALCLGASYVTAIDIDQNCVATTHEVLTKLAPGKNWKAEVRSIFDLGPDHGQFDVVYAWGALHHTGDMWRAIGIASQLVAPDGTLALAIYARTGLDWFWKVEKRLYSRSPHYLQWVIRQAYIGAYLGAQLAFLRSPVSALRGYKTRGMDFLHDAHDWLGGYPYETATATEIKTRLIDLGFSECRSFVTTPRLGGLLGSGCSEFVFSRSTGREL